MKGREAVRETATPKLRPARQTIPKAQAKDITMAFREDDLLCSKEKKITKSKIKN